MFLPRNADGLPCPFLDGKAQLRRKTHGPEDAQSILGKTLQRIPHTADHFFLHILLTAEQVHQPLLLIVGHGIDREIPPLQIFRKKGGKVTSLG